MRFDELVQRQLEQLQSVLKEVADEDLVLSERDVKVYVKEGSPSYIVFQRPDMEMCLRFMDESARGQNWMKATQNLLKETLKEVHIETADGRVILHLQADKNPDMVEYLMKHASATFMMWINMTILASVAKAMPFVIPQNLLAGMPATEEVQEIQIE